VPDDANGPSTAGEPESPPIIELVCDVGRLETPDLATVESLALLRIGVRAMGHGLRLEHVPPLLAGLIDFCGLTDTLTYRVSALVDEGEAEQREETRGVEEEAHPGDATP
jgi:hypothetical protein